MALVMSTENQTSVLLLVILLATFKKFHCLEASNVCFSGHKKPVALSG